jgi:hypothetical protein
MKIEKCRSCSAEIVWLTTKKGKTIPVDRATVKDGDHDFEYARHISHFATCPDAVRWRKPKV